MSRDLFLRIAHVVEACAHIVQKINEVDQLGHNALKNVAVAVCMLAYGCPTDSIDDWIGMDESICIKSLIIFVKAVIQISREEYLGAPYAEDTTRLIEMGAS